MSTAKKKGNASKVLLCAALARARQPFCCSSHSRGAAWLQFFPPALAPTAATKGNKAAANNTHCIPSPQHPKTVNTCCIPFKHKKTTVAVGFYMRRVYNKQLIASIAQ